MNCTSRCPDQGRIVRLLDGRDVCSCSDDWRHESECRWAFHKLDLRQRREHLAAVAAKRSPEARKRMEDTITVLHSMRKAAA